MTALPRCLLCIYTCEADREYLEALGQTRFYARVSAADNIRVLTVFADPALDRPIERDGRLILNCEEDYRNLSVKTQAMLNYCHERFAFDYLLKLDCTLVDYASRPSNRSHEMLRQVLTLDKVERLIFDPAFYDGEYLGLYWQAASREGIANWARVKKLPPPDLEGIFGERRELSYYAGKFYALSRRFCGFVARHGQAMAREHRQVLNGSEDLMIGRLYERYRQHDRS